jgi:hypothetical protein
MFRCSYRPRGSADASVPYKPRGHVAGNSKTDILNRRGVGMFSSEKLSRFLFPQYYNGQRLTEDLLALLFEE